MAGGVLGFCELNPLIDACAEPAKTAANTQQMAAERFMAPL